MRGYAGKRCPLCGEAGRQRRETPVGGRGIAPMQTVPTVPSVVAAKVGPSRLAGPIGLCLAVAITYFFAARLSLDLLTKPDGVAAFWPAAGIASGTLIALGPSARLPVAVGVTLATVVANALADRNIAGSLVFASCNAGEAI